MMLFLVEWKSLSSVGEAALVTFRSQIKTKKNFLSNATDVKSSSIH